ncbi:AAA domain-containing protein [Humisphaera borealis]|uniref:DUF4011 domain-containing protein n=1 Tax=Humisphaera borealis TaxID=2807512 RepID=A0A7M2WPI3_9BACT|nr:AAA domain-containing protein [Humisphaera borealis]QOV87323.1 DUF4011 domain-containing protein [Humisphaera borealis]
MTEPTSSPSSAAPVTSPTAAPPSAPAALPVGTAPPPPVNAAAGRKVLERMLDRLFAALVNGPSVNCRPHRSRQRIDWHSLSAMNDIAPAEALRDLLGDGRKAVLRARAPKSAANHPTAPRPQGEHVEPLVDQPVDEALRDENPNVDAGMATPVGKADSHENAEDVAVAAPSEDVVQKPKRFGRGATDARDPLDEQNTLLQKLHIIADDARTYEQDTGVHVLNVGFPLLSLPPSFAATATGRQSSRRILAPIAFIPVSLTLRRGATRSVEVACRGDGVDLVQPNTALLAWLQRQTGRSLDGVADLYADEKGEDPWRELTDLVTRVCEMVDLEIPEAFAPKAVAPAAADKPPVAEGLLGTPPKDTAAAPGDESEDLFDKLPEEETTEDAPEDAAVTTAAVTDTGKAPAPEPVSPPQPATPVVELQAAPRTDDLESSPQIVMSAVLGLFPMANQGLLRDMQEMVDNPGELRGPIAGFIRVGDLLDVGAPALLEKADAAVQAAKPAASNGKREFADERLVAAADPCQARAVRQARQSTALVIHGPPGTGKSQTIANIIGDHLSRGQRVLFVCEKRTALDVVADRLEHMGLGALTGVVHDPQRDQRELYKKIRDQLDNLAEAKERARSHKKLEELDQELQSLHAELTNYRMALARQDAETGYSFHELMGQWLSASPAALLTGGGEDNAHLGWRVTVEGKAAAELAKTRLQELSPLEHPLREMFTRGLKVAYAKNPWSVAVGTTLQNFLGRSVEQNKSALEAVVATAATADETSVEKQPLLPPFTQGLDVTAQATARLALLERLDTMLNQTPPEVLDRWAKKDLASIKTARSKITEALPYLSAFKQQIPEPELRARWVAVHGRDLPAVKDLTQQRTLVQKYAEAFGMSMQWVEQIRQKAPQAPWPTVARWMSTETSAAEAVLKKLEVAGPLAERASKTPLDAELLAQYRRQPFDIAQVLRWQSALETYLPIAKSFLGFLHGSKKKAASPVVEFFGLGLSFESASRVRDFLGGLRARLETWDATAKAIGPKAFGGATTLPDDAELFGVYASNRTVLRAASDLHRPALLEGSVAADATELVNQMVWAEYSMAAPVFELLELAPLPQNATRITALINALVVRVYLQNLNESVLNAPTPDDLMDDHDLEVSIRGHAALFDVALSTTAEPLTKDVWPVIAEALVDRTKLLPLIQAITQSPKRAADITAVEQAMVDAELFAVAWLRGIDLSLCKGEPVLPAVVALRDQLPTLEDVIRAKDALAAVPPMVRPAAEALLLQSAEPAEAWDVLRRDIIAGEIRRRIGADPQLQSVDGHRLSSAFERYRELQSKKRQLVCDVIYNRWLSEQQHRMLSANGERLNTAGAELKRRLLLRGERAMRLRQVVARGRQIAGGDPLFDICPVWMVSPETAAQVFPLEPIFDVVVFDEASQCRLEEALPVLVRGRRVVVAGDPKQLPPTRFFESAFAASDDDEDPTSDQEWFEQQQGEVEDLLTAALGLEAQQSYLDVHYRSRNAALIEFSNTHFYGSRLQPIPGHPGNRPEIAPIRLIRANGVYEKRKNEIEADAVVAVVRDLLAEKKPPSIGIACFNMSQRDLIVEKLDDLAAEDSKFAKKLSDARDRVGEGTFEGLFVKNLENVQGDERDHMIISTTYGPDAGGRFYRRFGPLAMPGGGRRLNVLVTRARQQVHLVTSIPEQAYRSLPEPAEGQTPGGGWLLFSYLKFADELTREIEGAPAESGPKQPLDADASEWFDIELPSDVEQSSLPPMPPVRIRPTRTPSSFAESLAHKLAAAHGATTEVYWGNDGFCVDLALRSGGDDAVPIGVLCDAARFAPADDLMEWDVFRTGILEAQGWKLHRIWTPHFFRDPAGRTSAILRDAGRAI